MQSFEPSAVLPEALILFEAKLVPPSLRERLHQLIVSTWQPSALDESTDAALERFDILVTGARELPNELLSRLTNLQVIVVTGTGFEFLDDEYCRNRGILVCNTPFYTGAAVAEFAFALLLERAKHLLTLDAAMRNDDDASDLVGIPVCQRDVRHPR